MTKPIFMRAVTDNGVTVLLPLKNQTQDIEGVKTDVETNEQCVTRDIRAKEFKEGEIWATETLIRKKSGWYSCGNELQRITDELGVPLNSGELGKQWTENYRDYTQGKPYTEFGEFKSEDPKEKSTKTLLDKLQADKKLNPPTIEDDGWYVDRDLWYFLVRNYKRKENTMLIGASGAGKTELVELMMSKINRSISIFDMAVSNPNKVFCGNLRAEDGSTYYQLARFAKQIQKSGLILMDELSRAAPTANNIFLPLLDNRRTLYIEDAIKESERRVVAHKDTCFWATANIGAEFVGTMTLDHALMNRFLPVPVSYPPRDKESLILQKRCNIASRVADSVVRVAEDIRNHSDLSKDVSTRQLIKIGNMISDGYNPANAFEWGVLQQFDGNLTDGGEKQTVKAILQAM